MNWVIFTTECSGKTTFCKKNNFILKNFKLVDWDKIKSIPNIDFENELLMVDVLLELKDTDDKIYFVNFLPPNFILESKNYFEKIRFGILLLDKNILISNIKQRHHLNYDSNYILQHYDKLSNVNESGKIRCFTSFENFVEFFNPKINTNLTAINKRIIRL